MDNGRLHKEMKELQEAAKNVSYQKDDQIEFLRFSLELLLNF